MSSSTTHPLTVAWLRDLELLLHGIDPGDRAEVLAGARDHLDGSLPPAADDDEVRRVLADLGSPQSVADEAYAGRDGTSTGEVRPTSTPGMARSWVPVADGTLLGAYLLWMVLVVGGSMSYRTLSTGSSVQVSSTGEEIGPVLNQVSYDANPVGGIVLGLAASALLWFPAIALALFSPLWSPRQKTTLCLLPLGAVTAVSALPGLGFLLTRSELGIHVGAWVGAAAAVVGGGLLTFRLCRSALSASTEGASA